MRELIHDRASEQVLTVTPGALSDMRDDGRVKVQHGVTTGRKSCA